MEGLLKSSESRLGYFLYFWRFRRIGRGYFGTVYKMRVSEAGPEVAVKELQLTQPDIDTRRILNESIFGAKVGNCPYALKSYGCLLQDGTVRLFMEIMDMIFLSASLQTHAMGEIVPEQFIAYITKCIVTGLEFLNRECNIHHRDVKPSNMLVDRSGQVKICDFGMSNEMIDMKTMTNVGTFIYQAPERLDASSGFRIQSDVWSLGLSVYKIATNDHPYAQLVDSLDYMNTVLQSDIPTLPEGDEEAGATASYSSVIRDFLAFCLVKEERQRPDFAALLQSTFLAPVDLASVKPDFAAFVTRILAAGTPSW
ncbi:unnamed protein product [Schistocephalus solidus]|uniref:mitogen-activated protein kinase kinase n=1 Tax=Schistocephalus solidus TaxID=70667 RepID=A0A183SZJ8_SCHSO|nr:unnamed protein product [Schistocephalus solidus]